MYKKICYVFTTEQYGTDEELNPVICGKKMDEPTRHNIKWNTSSVFPHIYEI